MSTTLVTIGGVGFMFEVRQNLKQNLISPDVLTFFNGVHASGEVTEDCAFPASIPLTNQRLSIFHEIGDDWVVCSDGIFRKCAMTECEIRQNDTVHIIAFYIDSTLKKHNIVGVFSKL